jgi:2-octaprenyl-6-methoxyphenol hydroxylase
MSSNDMRDPAAGRSESFDVAVVGGGPAGLTAAIAIAAGGARVALVARKMPYRDNRTTALLDASVEILRDLEVWDQCAEHAAALRRMRLVDDTGRLIRAPEVHFDCEEIGLDAFGYNIENRILVETLENRASALPGLIRFDDHAATIEAEAALARVVTGQGARIEAPLIVGADGRQSPCRTAAGISVSTRPTRQSAVTFNIAHDRPHNGVSTEFHTAAGPCVFVPLPGNRSSVVWVMRTEDAERTMALPDDAFTAAITRQSHYHLGRLTADPERHVFPLAFAQASSLAASRIALVGEAAHVFPPIGAQGLNLGIRDAAGIARVIDEARTFGDDPGAEASLVRYRNLRRLDVQGRMMVIGLANSSLLSGFLPLQAARAVGMQLLQQVGPLRRFAMRHAIAPSARL